MAKVKSEVKSFFIMDESTHYGDGQHYYNCDECGAQACARGEEIKVCPVCGNETTIIDGYPEDRR